jgi:hypothetical protein
MGRFNFYVHHLEDHASSRLFPTLTDAERVASGTSVTGMHFVGPYTDGWATLNSFNDGVINGHVAIYAPPTVRGGSSYVHPSNLLNPNNLMEPLYNGASHDTSLVEAILLDAGWSEALNEQPPTTTTTTTLPPSGSCKADVNCDGAVTTVDALLALKESVGLSSSCQCTE